MKKFILGAIAALSLFASSANAFPFICSDCVVAGGGASDTGKYEVVTWDDTISDYDISLETDPNGSTPIWKFDYPNGVYLGSNKLIDLLAAKQDSSSSFSGAYSDLTGKPTLFDGTWGSLSGKPSTFTPSSHTHVESDITNLTTDLAGKAAASTVIGTGSTIAAASTSATASASASSITILGIDVPTNASYTALVSDYNDLATKENDLATKYNTLLAELKARNVPSN